MTSSDPTPESATDDGREHVAILGGGVGGCVAAYWLTSTPELRRRYRVTLYQMGWRLGGKGASSRRWEGGKGKKEDEGEGEGEGEEKKEGFRSEEHGPHVWFGFYENAFRTMRGCLEEHARLGHTLGGRSDWLELFEPSDEGVFYQQDGGGRWRPWRMRMPSYGESDGEPGDDRPLPDVRDSLWRLADQMALNLRGARVFGRWQEKFLRWIGGVLERRFPVEAPPDSHCRREEEGCAPTLSAGDPSGMASYLSRRLVDLADSERVWYGEWVVGRGLQLFLDLIGWRLRRLKRKARRDSELQRELWILDLVRTCLRGSLVDLLIRDKTFSELDRIEFLAWLKSHGAVYHRIEDSPLLRTYYDTPFAYCPKGAGKGKAVDDVEESSRGEAANGEEPGAPGSRPTPDFAAGAALRGFLRIFFGHKGSFLYRMTMGMGECVFVPFYRVLRERGVEFKFFHKVTGMVPNELGNRVERVVFSRQAELKPGVAEYQPLTEAKNRGGGEPWPAWPHRPDVSQLEAGSLPDAKKDPGFESAWSEHAGRRVEIFDRRSKAPEAEGCERFDRVVLAIPPGAHEQIAAPLVRGYERFRRMVESAGTTRTIACQLWVSGAEGGLRWQGPFAFCEKALAGASPDPFNVVLEATPILATENHPQVTDLIYLCGPWPDDENEPPHTGNSGYPAEQWQVAKESSIKWLEGYGHLWPGLCDGEGRIDWNRLHHPRADASGDERRDWQYFRLNIDPSERYVLSGHRMVPDRLEPQDTGYNNLVFAGDWCRNRIDIGCVESASTSGMLASHHICGVPEWREIAGMQYR